MLGFNFSFKNTGALQFSTGTTIETRINVSVYE